MTPRSTPPRAITIAVVIGLIAAAGVPAFSAERVSVSVVGLFHPKQLVVEAAPSSPILVKAGRDQIVAGIAGPQRITLTFAGARVVAQMNDTRVAGEKVLFAARDGNDAQLYLSVPGKLRRRYRGKLTVIAARTELVAVLDVDLETAVASVVAAELPGDAPLEAVKAQAVVSRSYLVSGARRHRYADFCDTTHCQFLREPPPTDSRAAQATLATSGMVLTWKGKPFPAMFSASCGGHTHSFAQVGFAAVNYPYYAVECPYCRNAPDRWSSQLTRKYAAALSSHSETSRVQTGRKLGWKAVQSNTFTRTETSGVVDLSGVGRGHGLGLCQRGAAGMANSGQDFRAILAHYFPNTTVD